jgi:hypothetical protein
MTLFNLTACGGKTENTNKKSWAENNSDRWIFYISSRFCRLRE